MWSHGIGVAAWTWSHARCAELSGQIAKSAPAAPRSRADSSMKPRHAGIVARVERRKPCRHRNRVHRDARMIVLADESERVPADRLIAERRALRAASHDPDVLHDLPFSQNVSRFRPLAPILGASVGNGAGDLNRRMGDAQIDLAGDSDGGGSVVGDGVGRKSSLQSAALRPELRPGLLREVTKGGRGKPLPYKRQRRRPDTLFSTPLLLLAARGVSQRGGGLPPRAAGAERRSGITPPGVDPAERAERRCFRKS